MIKFSLTHVRHDPAHCLAPGLFRSLKKGDRKKLKLDVFYSYSDDESIEFKAPEPLGVDDLRVLQGLIALSGPDGVILTSCPKSEAGMQLRESLKIKGDAEHENALVVRGSYRELAKEIGYKDIDNGKVFRQIRASIERLWMVSIIVQKSKCRMGFKLLSAYGSDESTGKLFIALNPRIAEAVLGKRAYTRIDMNEVRALESDAARLIHQRLCGWIDQGKIGRVDIDTLSGYVWIDKCNAEAMKKRKQTIRKSLLEFLKLGWEIEEYVKYKYEIYRPKVKKEYKK